MHHSIYDQDPFIINLVETSIDSKGWSIEEIGIKNINELKESLINISNAIENPDSIDEITVNGGKVDIVPLLLERKKVIINRIKELTTVNALYNINEFVNQMPEGDVKQKIEKEINGLQDASLDYKKELQNITIREAEIKIKLEQQRLDGLERKSKIWLSFLQRESAASIVGAVVLLLLTFSLIVGMVFGWESQVLSNGFLVILGYFFGQSSSRNNKDNDAGGACG